MQEEKKYSFKKILIIIFLILILFGLWARYINTKGLKVKEYGIVNKNLPSSFHGLKIVHFSDVLYGNTTNLDDLKNIVTKINELKADIVFFTGDLIDKNAKISEKELSNITKELQKIETTLYKYAISGDNDLSIYNEYKSTIENAGFILLNNSNELLYYKSETPVKIVGLTDTSDLENAFKEDSPAQSFSIVLMHKPDNVDILEAYQPNLAFAGHSLGGQIKIPLLGGIIKKDGASKYLADYYKVHNTELYISNGIGTENFKFRTFNKPSINFYRLYNK